MTILVLDPADVGTASDVTDDDFELDMRVVEFTTPLVITQCSTSDGCGQTCGTSACSTKANHPL